MTPQELAPKLTAKVEFMILQYMPKPTCATKHQAWREQVEEVKRLMSARLNPNNNGITITV